MKTYYVLLFLHLESRRICLAGVTRHPQEQMARNITTEGAGFLANCRICYMTGTASTCTPFCQLIGAVGARCKAT
jgi:hypothetical protein